MISIHTFSPIPNEHSHLISRLQNAGCFVNVELHTYDDFVRIFGYDAHIRAGSLNIPIQALDDYITFHKHAKSNSP